MCVGRVIGFQLRFLHFWIGQQVIFKGEPITEASVTPGAPLLRDSSFFRGERLGTLLPSKGIEMKQMNTEREIPYDGQDPPFKIS